MHYSFSQLLLTDHRGDGGCGSGGPVLPLVWIFGAGGFVGLKERRNLPQRGLLTTAMVLAEVSAPWSLGSDPEFHFHELVENLLTPTHTRAHTDLLRVPPHLSLYGCCLRTWTRVSQRQGQTPKLRPHTSRGGD